MNTQNILNSQKVKDFFVKQEVQDNLHSLGVPYNSTYSPEAQKLEDPWLVKEENKKKFKEYWSQIRKISHLFA